MPRPGQFFMLSSAAGWGGGLDERPYLPRAFSHARAREGRLSFLLDAIGPGTERLAELAAGEGTGPRRAARGWLAPRREGPVPVLVGGGIGAAPLLVPPGRARTGRAGAARLPLRGPRRGARELFAGRPEVATDDGSAGRRALVTELLREELDRRPTATVFACGPAAMLEAVRELCAERRRARPARAGVGDGLRLRGLLRLRRADRGGLRPAVRGGPVLAAAQLEPRR